MEDRIQVWRKQETIDNILHLHGNDLSPLQEGAGLTRASSLPSLTEEADTETRRLRARQEDTLLL